MVAICVRCGAQKIGAFSPCAGCRYDPATETDRRIQAKTLWLSDQHLKPAALATIARQIKAGEAVAFEEQALDGLVLQLRTQQIPVVGQSPLRWALLVWGLVAVLALSAAGTIAFYLYAARG